MMRSAPLFTTHSRVWVNCRLILWCFSESFDSDLEGCTLKAGWIQHLLEGRENRQLIYSASLDILGLRRYSPIGHNNFVNPRGWERWRPITISRQTEEGADCVYDPIQIVDMCIADRFGWLVFWAPSLKYQINPNVTGSKKGISRLQDLYFGVGMKRLVHYLLWAGVFRPYRLAFDCSTSYAYVHIRYSYVSKVVFANLTCFWFFHLIIIQRHLAGDFLLYEPVLSAQVKISSARLSWITFPLHTAQGRKWQFQFQIRPHSTPSIPRSPSFSDTYRISIAPRWYLPGHSKLRYN